MKKTQTDNLTIIDYGDDTGKLQIFNKFKSYQGWTSRDLLTSLFALPLKEITYDYIKNEVDEIYELFDYSEIEELLTKLNKNENKKRIANT
jgi:hypothetical protein